jgi:hypothetical protein
MVTFVKLFITSVFIYWNVYFPAFNTYLFKCSYELNSVRYFVMEIVKFQPVKKMAADAD